MYKKWLFMAELLRDAEFDCIIVSMSHDISNLSLDKC